MADTTISVNTTKCVAYPLMVDRVLGTAWFKPAFSSKAQPSPVENPLILGLKCFRMSAENISEIHNDYVNVNDKPKY